MRKSLVLMLALLGIPVLTSAQINPTGTISTAGSDCSTATNCVGWSTLQSQGFGVYINVATSGTFVFEVSQDATAITNGTWVTMNDNNGLSSETTDGAYYFANTGFLYFRVRASAINGSATIQQAPGYSSGISTAGSGISAALSGEYNLTPPTLSDAGTDSLQLDVNGRLLSNIFPTTPSAVAYIPTRLTDGSAFLTFGEDYLHDQALTRASTGGPIDICTAKATSPTAVSADDDAVLAWCLLNGARVVATIDPCSQSAKTFYSWDITSATTTEITPSLSGSGNYWYICSINGVTTAANNINLVDDNSDGCGSVTASLVSTGLAAGDGWGFAANGGIAQGNGGSTIMKSVTSNSVLCFVTSAASEFHGQIGVVAAP